eukprot:GHVU01202423.1.p1 GENE.GHVU01202423.1~~GHVU01202423.1.p1  ORF type:complete len:607 (+),score=44.77 GHVU01202423.1:196-2016(+)
MESLFVRVTYRSYISAETDDKTQGIPSNLHLPGLYSSMNDVPEEGEQLSDEFKKLAISASLILRFWEVVSHRCTHGRLLLKVGTELNEVHKVDSKKPETLQLDASETVLLDLRETGLSDPLTSDLNYYNAVLSRLNRSQQNNEDVSSALSSFIATQLNSVVLLNNAMQVIRDETTATAEKALMCVRATFGTGTGLAGSYAGVILQATASLKWDPENPQRIRKAPQFKVYHRSNAFFRAVRLLKWGQIFDDCRNTADGTKLLVALGDQLPRGRQGSALRFLAHVEKAGYDKWMDAFTKTRGQKLTMEQHRVAYLLDVLNDILPHMSEEDTSSLSRLLETQTRHTKEAATQCLKEIEASMLLTASREIPAQTPGSALPYSSVPATEASPTESNPASLASRVPITSDAEAPNVWVKNLLGDFRCFIFLTTRQTTTIPIRWDKFRIPTHEDMKMTPEFHQLFGNFVIRVFWYIFGGKCGDPGERNSLLRADVTYEEDWNFNEIPIQSTQTELLHLQRLAFVEGGSSNILRFRLLYYADPLARLSVDTRQVLGHVLTVMQVPTETRRAEVGKKVLVKKVADNIKDVTDMDPVVKEAKRCLGRKFPRSGNCF